MRALGFFALFVNGFGLSSAAAQAGLGNWKAAAIYGIVGSAAGIVSRFALMFERRTHWGVG